MKTTKRFALLAWVFAAGSPVEAQNLLWARSYGGPAGDFSNSLVLDDAGNAYVSGGFSGTVVFGAGEPNETVLTSTSGSPYDMFLAKHDRGGELVWVKQVPGTGVVAPTGIALDSSENVLVAGAFDLTTTFGPGEPFETSFTADGSLDAFLAKFDDDGNLVWARKAGGTGLNFHQGVGVDSSGGICVGGFFNGSMDFGPGNVLDSLGGDDIHVARYDADGSLLWARGIGGADRDEGYDVTADDSGSCYLSGEVAGTVVVDPGGPNETTLTTSESGSDVLVVKYDASGALAWARSAEGSNCAGGREIGRRIAIDPSGDVRVAGYFCSGPATFGAGEANETTLTSAGNWDIFTAKYGPNGALAWAKRAGGLGQDQGVDVSWDELGHTYVTGRFDDGAVFGPGESNETTLAAEGEFDAFTAKYDGGGNLLWVRQAGGESDDHGAGIDVDRLGDARVTGNFESPFAVFGFGEANETTLFTNGGYDGFLATFESTVPDKLDLLIHEVRSKESAGEITGPAADRLVQSLLRARAGITRGLGNLAIVSLSTFSLLVRIYVATGAVSPSVGPWLMEAAGIIIEQIQRTG
jgi:hypothetical protein